MKYPTISRLFAVILAIMSIVLMFTGIYGLINTFDDNESNLYKLELLKERTATYEEYSQKLAGKPSYAQSLAEYEKRKEDYDKLFGNHKTDTAVYSATEGGIKEGKEALETTPAMLIKGQEELTKYMAQVEDGLVQIEGGLTQIDGGLAQLSDENRAAAIEMAKVGALEATKNAVKDQILAEPKTAVAGIQGQIDAVNDAISVLNAQKAALNPEEEDYQSNIDSINAQIAVENGKLEPLNSGLSDAKAALAAAETYAELMVSDYTVESPEVQPAINTAVETVNKQFDDNIASLNSKKKELLSKKQEVEYNKAVLMEKQQQIYAAWDMLSLSEIEIKHLEKEMPETVKKLQEEKEKLDKEGKELAELNEFNEQLKVDEKKLTSTTLLLKSNEHIKKSVDSGEDIVSAAKEEIVRYENAINLEYILRVVSNCGLMLAAVLGIVEVFAAFEKIKHRFWLIAPVFLIILLCAFSEAVSLYLERGNMYSAIVAGSVAVLTLIFVLPKAKKELG